MQCPFCGYKESKVIDSRSADDGIAIRRRRECLSCEVRFTTYERYGERPVIVVKSDGSSEAFDREKLMRSIMVACAKRPISPEIIDAMISDIETTIRQKSGEISSKDLGEMVLKRLAAVDHVAYIRFASVYKDFQSVEEFASALEDVN